MKITKFFHSCLLVEMPDPINRTALFDPGMMNQQALDVGSLEYLDDIIITHGHADHVSIPLVKKIHDKFPEVRITTTAEVVEMLQKEGITASSEPTEGVEFFDSLHESVEPMFETPQQIGVHYLGLLSHPGDSHSFSETKSILALPITGPWGSTVKAVNLALELKPQYILPIHDWPLKDEVREQTYGNLAKLFEQHGIRFLPLTTGEPVIIET